MHKTVNQGNSYWSGRISTIDLLVLTSSDQLFFILKVSLFFLTKQPTLKGGLLYFSKSSLVNPIILLTEESHSMPTET